jgi:hypothetical protein
LLAARKLGHLRGCRWGATRQCDSIGIVALQSCALVVSTLGRPSCVPIRGGSLSGPSRVTARVRRPAVSTLSR